MKAKVCAAVSLFYVYSFSSCFWCTLWHTWETCAMASLCSSSVRNAYHHWTYESYWYTLCLSLWQLYFFFSCRCDRCLFSAPFLYTTSGSNFFFYLYTHWYLMSTISFNICTLFLLYSRSRLMALLQKSRPKLTTSRTCEYDAILWQNGAITNTVELMISDTSFYFKYAPELTAQSIIHTV